MKRKFIRVIWLFISIILISCSENTLRNSTEVASTVDVAKFITKTPSEFGAVTNNPTATKTQSVDVVSLDAVGNCPHWDWTINQHIYMRANSLNGMLEFYNVDLKTMESLELSFIDSVSGYFWYPSRNAVGFVTISLKRSLVKVLDLETCLIQEHELSEFEHLILSKILLGNLGSYPKSDSPIIPLKAYSPSDDDSKLYFVRADWGLNQLNWISPDGKYVLLNAGYPHIGTDFPYYSLTIADLVNENVFEINFPEIHNHDRLTWQISWSPGQSILGIDNYLYNYNLNEGIGQLPSEIFPPYDWGPDSNLLLYNESYPNFHTTSYDKDNGSNLEYDFNSTACTYNLITEENKCYPKIREYHSFTDPLLNFLIYDFHWIKQEKYIGYSFYAYDQEESLNYGGGYCLFDISEEEVNCLTDDLEMNPSLPEDSVVRRAQILQVMWSNDEEYLAMLSGYSCPLCDEVDNLQISLKNIAGDTIFHISEEHYPGVWKP